jgi:hypothetical protein
MRPDPSHSPERCLRETCALSLSTCALSLSKGALRLAQRAWASGRRTPSVQADGLAGRISAAAADAARSQHVLLELIGEFDAVGAIRYWTDFKSVAHWLSWACAMTPGVAREHVRVAKALRRMPQIAGLFAEAGCRIRRCGRSPGWWMWLMRLGWRSWR